jgi:DNA-binding response OmpR family regulator
MNEPEQSMSFRLQGEFGDGAASSVSPRAKTILVVDDYRSLCELVASMLQPCGYRVLIASSGEEAMAITAREDETIDLLLTDIEMPQMRGDELAEWFRSQKPTAPILFMSSQAPSRKSIQSAYFLQKPFRPQELIGKVRDFFRPISASSAEDNSSSDHANQQE